MKIDGREIRRGRAHYVASHGQESCGGEGGAIGVVGEPGVGKSRLCLEFVERTQAAGTAIYAAHCPPHGKTIPFLPLLELLRDLFDITESARDHEARRKIAGELLLLDLVQRLHCTPGTKILKLVKKRP